MTTGTPGTSARQDPRQVINTLKKIVNFNDTGVGAGTAQTFDNPLPQGAFITNVQVETVTTFNAGTTNVLVVGTNPTTFNNLIASGDVSLTAAGTTSVSRGWGRSITNASDTTPFAVFTQTGSSATQGSLIIVLTYEGGWAS